MQIFKWPALYTDESTYKDITFYTPGSKNAENKASSSYPYYNEILGVFNLLNTPEVRYRNYAYNTSTYHYFCPGGRRASIAIKEREFLLYELKYLLNPASGLQPFEVMGILVFKKGKRTIYQTPPTPIGELGVTPISFGYITESCHNSYRLIGMSRNIDIPDEVELRLLVNLRRPDASTNSDAQNVLIQMVHPIKLVEHHEPLSKKSGWTKRASMHIPCRGFQSGGSGSSASVPARYTNNDVMVINGGGNLAQARRVFLRRQGASSYMDFKKTKVIAYNRSVYTHSIPYGAEYIAFNDINFWGYSWTSIKPFTIKYGGKYRTNVLGTINWSDFYSNVTRIWVNTAKEGFFGRIRQVRKGEIANFCNSSTYKARRVASGRIGSSAEKILRLELRRKTFCILSIPTPYKTLLVSNIPLRIQVHFLCLSLILREEGLPKL